MSQKLHVKTGDTVVVISGKDKGKQGVIKACEPKKSRVVVEGVNVVKKTLKPTQQNPEGGVVEKEAAIDASNVMLYDKKAKAASRVSIKVDDKGKKVRVYKKSGAEVKGGKK